MDGAAPNELRLCLNPPNKEAKLFWRPTDQIIVMRRTAEDAQDRWTPSEVRRCCGGP